jgi:PD-(D/E)XK nuclease superfamily
MSFATRRVIVQLSQHRFGALAFLGTDSPKQVLEIKSIYSEFGNERKFSTYRTVTDLVDLHCPYEFGKKSLRDSQSVHYESDDSDDDDSEDEPRNELEWQEGTKVAESPKKQGKKFHEAMKNFFDDNHEKIPYDVTSKEWKQFLAFQEKEHLKVHTAEMDVESRKHKVKGRVDMVAENGDDTFDIYDWKRSNMKCKRDADSFGSQTKALLALGLKNNLFGRCTLQMNLYRICLEEQGHAVRNMHIVFFHPNAKKYKKVKIPRMESVAQAVLEIDPSDDMEDGKDEPEPDALIFPSWTF